MLKTAENKDKVARNIAVLASKKIFKTAVLRNKARRKIRAAVTAAKKASPALLWNDSKLAVITAYDNILSVHHLDLARDMRNILEKSGMLG